ncbi:TVP38/TMEM64 family protein [Methylococcus sp. EFPC2]|uniref:TVP38/TMEM64 family protein n=1 Tax=Methylococcus sp. EFPC2 TaxID=2812648 RepID=UPI00196724DF|nr:VTT domain-containing protein [Methylococcus sp. EFPC2]QSA96246.1 TVP38/TMEM64 family protein [Methylococcus sp. EFPC2]
MTDIELSAIEIPTTRRRIGGLVNGGVFLLVLALGMAVYFTPLKSWLEQGQAIKDELAVFGLAAPAIFVLAAASLTAIGVPRLLVCSLAGMVFGLAWGLVWSQAATVLGSYATFLFVRWRGRDYTLAHFPRLKRVSDTLEGRGVLSVLLLRQLPMNGFYNNVFLGLTPVAHRDFLLGSLLGFLPLGVTACLIGAGLIQGEVTKGVQYLSLAFVCSLVLGYGLKYWADLRRNQDSAR